jgi:hypothetical protein
MPEIRRNGLPMRGIQGFDSLEGASPGGACCHWQRRRSSRADVRVIHRWLRASDADVESSSRLSPRKRDLARRRDRFARQGNARGA